MSLVSPPPTGWHFEDFQPGQRILTQGRTITEADVVNFAGLSGDYNLIHTHAPYAAESHFGQRVAHGLLIVSIVSGLAVRTGILEGTVLAFREIESWKFSKPVHIGDTVSAELTVRDTKENRRLGGGLVSVDLAVKNQEGETVMKGSWSFLMASRAAASA